MSHAFETEVVYFGFVSYVPSDGVVQPQDRAVFDRIETSLVGLGARPHWGKYFSPSLVRRHLGEHADRFRHAVQRYDRGHVFQNDYYYRALGPEE